MQKNILKWLSVFLALAMVLGSIVIPQENLKAEETEDLETSEPQEDEDSLELPKLIRNYFPMAFEQGEEEAKDYWLMHQQLTDLVEGKGYTYVHYLPEEYEVSFLTADENGDELQREGETAAWTNIGKLTYDSYEHCVVWDFVYYEDSLSQGFRPAAWYLQTIKEEYEEEVQNILDVYPNEKTDLYVYDDYSEELILNLCGLEDEAIFSPVSRSLGDGCLPGPGNPNISAGHCLEGGGDSPSPNPTQPKPTATTKPHQTAPTATAGPVNPSPTTAKPTLPTSTTRKPDFGTIDWPTSDPYPTYTTYTTGGHAKPPTTYPTSPSSTRPPVPTSTSRPTSTSKPTSTTKATSKPTTAPSTTNKPTTAPSKTDKPTTPPSVVVPSKDSTKPTDAVLPVQPSETNKPTNPSVNVNVDQKEEFKPEVITEVIVVGENFDLKDNIKNLPEGAIVVVENTPDNTKPGSGKAPVLVILEDGTRVNVDIPYVVLEPKLHIFEVGEDAKFESPINGVPEGATVVDVDPKVDTSYVHSGDHKMKVTIDGVEKLVDVPYIVIDKIKEIIPKDETPDFTDNITLPDDIKDPIIKPVKPLPDTSKPHEGTHKVEVIVPGGSKVVDVPYEVIDSLNNGNFDYKKVPDKKTVKWNEDIFYTFIVKNNSGEVARDIRITDLKLGIENLLIKDQLNPGEEFSYRHNKAYRATKEEVKAGVVYNDAKVKAKDPRGKEAVDKPNDKEESKVNVTAPVDAKFSIVKKADKTLIRPGEEIKYSFTITNLSDQVLSDITLNDPKLGINNKLIKPFLAVGEQFTYEHEEGYKPTKEELQKGDVRNVSTVTVTDPDGHKTTRESNPEIAKVDKKDYGKPLFKKLSMKEVYTKGEKIFYKFEILNTTEEEIREIRINDPKLNIQNLFVKDKLAPGEKFIYEHATGYEPTKEEVKAGEVLNDAKLYYKDKAGLEREVDAEGPGLKIKLHDKAKIYMRVLEVDKSGRLTGKVVKEKTLVKEDVLFGEDYKVEAPKIDGFKEKGLHFDSDPAIGKALKDEILVSFTYERATIETDFEVVFENYPKDKEYPSYVWVTIKDKDGKMDFKLRDSDRFKDTITLYEDIDYKVEGEDFEGFKKIVEGDKHKGYKITYRYEGAPKAGVTTSGGKNIPATGESSGKYYLGGAIMAGLFVIMLVLRKNAFKSKKAKN